MHGTSSVLKLAVNLKRDIIRTLGSWGFSHKEGTDSVKPLHYVACLEISGSIISSFELQTYKAL